MELLESDFIQRASSVKTVPSCGSCAKINACTARTLAAWRPALPMAPSSNTPTASSIFSRTSASVAAIASPVALSIFPSSIPKQNACTSARCALIASAKASSPPASKLSHRMPALWHQRRHARASQFPRQTIAGAFEFPARRRLRSARRGRHWRDVVLHDITKPEIYGGLPADPRIPWSVKLWKHPLKWLGNVAMVGGLIGLFVHYIRFGPEG